MEIFQIIREKAWRYLALRSHSIFELKQKLLKKFPEDKETVEAVLKECVELKMLNDQNFAEEFVRYRQETSPRGKFALKMELQKKGIAAEIISEVLENLSEEDEFAQAKILAERKLRSFPADLEKKKQKEKLFRFLVSKGFSQGIVFRIFEQIIPN